MKKSYYLDPIVTESLKDVFVNKFEALILSGKVSIGEILPSERELAAQLKVSRPVVHDGLIDLAVKGLVTIKPRSGTVVNDFRTQGSIPLLLSLLNYHGTLDPNLQQDILEMRLLFENEMVRLCALHRNEEHLDELERIVHKEQTIDRSQFQEVAAVDYAFHQVIALASGNLIYSLLLNSFKEIYLNLSSLFFSDPAVCESVFDSHQQLLETIREHDAEKSVSITTQMLNYGAEHLELIIKKSQLRSDARIAV